MTITPHWHTRLLPREPQPHHARGHVITHHSIIDLEHRFVPLKSNVKQKVVTFEGSVCRDTIGEKVRGVYLVDCLR